MKGRAIGAALLFVLALGCASNGTDATLAAAVGHPVQAFIDEHGYPADQVDLPGGERVYHFRSADGAFLRHGHGWYSHSCDVWLQTSAAGIVTKYRAEGCD